MTSPVPAVYLLHGEDEYAIAQFVTEIESKLGDGASAEMNISRLDGRNFDPGDLLSIAGAMPFLADRRVVVYTNFLARLNSPSARKHFEEILEKVPATTALLLVEYRTLTEDKDRRKGKLHWLERWATQHPEQAYVKQFSTPKGPAFARWIERQAKQAGGQFEPEAAALLGTLVGEDPRLAENEIQKLLAYVNYQRPVGPEDVQVLTADSAQGDIFVLVDALGTRNGRQASGMLRRLLEEQDPFSIFGMVVRQFRLLLLAREVIESGGRDREVASQLRIHPYVAGKVSEQARRFSISLLEAVYHRLLDLDEGMKTGQIAADLALETLVAGFCE